MKKVTVSPKGDPKRPPGIWENHENSKVPGCVLGGGLC